VPSAWGRINSYRLIGKSPNAYIIEYNQLYLLMPDTFSFNGSEGAPIDLETAKRWAQAYRAQNPGQTKAHFFGRNILQQLLAEPGSLGIRLYYGIDDKGAKQIMAVGAIANGDDLLPSAGTNNIVADSSWPCPPYCGLNSL
jgi:hypothetical protein